MFIKQVPDTDDVKWTENNNIDRTNMESILNPLDKQALEAALNLKDKYNVHITAVTMGPKKAEAILKEAIALGADDAILLCDSQFAGSDTNATSTVLAYAIKEKLPQTDLILCGQTAIDGETSQTGISTASRLDCPCITNVNEIIEISDEKYLIVNSETEKEQLTVKTKLPCVICINNYKTGNLIPKISGYIKAKDYNIKSFNMYELNIPADTTGVKGSPTYVQKVYRNQEFRNCQFISTDNDNYSKILKEEIKKVMEL